MEQMNRLVHKKLLVILIVLTSIIIIAQYAYFISQNIINHLDDSILRSPLVHAFLRPIVLVPFMQYLFFQMIWYVLFVTWIWLLTVTLQRRYALKNWQTYFTGCLLWLCAVIAVLALNNHFYPHSYFAVPNHPSFGTVALLLSSVPLLIITVYTYVRVYQYREHLVVATVLLLCFMWALGSSWRSTFFTLPFLAENPPLNVLLVALSTLPDGDSTTTNVFSSNTPHLYL
jgi:hypothetical protein